MSVDIQESATLTVFADVIIQTDGRVHLEGGQLDAQLVQVDGGTLSGTGAIYVGSGPIHGNVRNRTGTIQPGHDNGHPVGTIAIDGDFAQETLSSVIDMRNQLMSKFFLKTEDVIFLRGAQEEMFLKLLQLHTAPNPYEIVKWLFDHGVDKTIRSFLPAMTVGCSVISFSQNNSVISLKLAEDVNNSDLPEGTLNFLAGDFSKIIDDVSRHVEVNALALYGKLNKENLKTINENASTSVKRVFNLPSEEGLSSVLPFIETKTVWHPKGR